MADPITDFAIVAIAAAVAVITFLELRLLRIRKGRRKPPEEFLEDNAHNALLTTRAIASSLERRGINSPQAEALIREGEEELSRRHHRQALASFDRARMLLSQAKEAQPAQPAANVEVGPPITKSWQASEERSAELQARFAVGKASKALEHGGSPSFEAQMLAEAKAALESKDFKSAVAKAQKALKSLGRAEAIGLSPTLSTDTLKPCPSCGAPLRSDDATCPLCGQEPAGE